MMKSALLGVCGLVITGCAPFLAVEKAQKTDLPEVSCFTRPQGGCVFDHNPLRVETKAITIQNRPYKFFPTSVTLNFVDALGRDWQAPKGTLTDGASIPEIFTAIVGKPTSPEYINAAAVHDAYCGIGNESGPRFHDGRWEDVHRMFYDGLIVGGTPELRAKLMYAAVWLGGPRWETTRMLDRVSDADLQTAMKATKNYISANSPTLPELDRYLRKWENHLLLDTREEEVLEDNAAGPLEPYEPTYPEEPYEPTYPDDPYDPTYPGDPNDPTDPGLT